MTFYVFDAAYAPDLAKVKAAGGIAVNGYITGKYSASTSQPAAAHSAGLGYVATYEEMPNELVGASRMSGQDVGQRILAAFKAKGIPTDGTVAVYPSVDVNAGASSCNAAWRGMLDILDGKVSLRAYAEGAIIDALHAAGLVQGKCWLAAPTSWPGFSNSDPNVCMVQEVGTPVAGTDRNHIIGDPRAIGAWWPEGSEYSDMALTKDDAQTLWSAPLVDGAKVSESAGVRLIRAERHAADAISAATALAVQLKAVQDAVAKLQTGGVDPVAVAKAIAEHVALTSK